MGFLGRARDLAGIVVIGLPLCLFVHFVDAIESWLELLQEWREAA